MRTLIRFVSRVFSGLRFRLLLLVLLVCAPLAGLILHRAWEDRHRAEAAWHQRLQRVLETARREEEEICGGTRQLLLAVSESASVRSLNPRRCKKWIDELFAGYPRYSNLGVISTNGELIASAAPVNGTTNFLKAAFYQRASKLRGFAIGDIATSEPDRSPTLFFGYPVLDRDGLVSAVVFAELDLQWFYRFGSEVPAQLPHGAIWTEIDPNGRIFVRYPKPEVWIGRMTPFPSLAKAAFSRSTGVLETSDDKNPDTVHAFGTFPSQLVPGELAGVLSIPRHYLFAEADLALVENLAWFTVAAGIAIALGLAGSRLLVIKPVEALVSSSARLASGDLSARTGLPHTRDELGQLTLAFDKMAEALEHREMERQRASQKLQVLSHRIVEVQETERRHIARELHDEIGQSLTAAEMSLQAALQSPSTAALERRLEQSLQAVDRVLSQVHDLSLNLRPSMLDDLGLEPALRWYTHRQQEVAGLRAEFSAEPLQRRLDPIIETECFRVAQEALTNISRHSKAHCVTVELDKHEGHLHLRVRDDGVGFDVGRLRSEAVRGASLGLLSMEERATLAGGGFEILSAPGKGTEVHAWFPLRWQNEQPRQ